LLNPSEYSPLPQHDITRLEGKDDSLRLRSAPETLRGTNRSIAAAHPRSPGQYMSVTSASSIPASLNPRATW
jgi:hypothetical protein